MQPPGKATPPSASASAPALATPALRPAEPLKKLMASVTFIAPTVENEFLEKLFAIFGPVKSMKRPQDPATQAYKTFAFVEYETPESLRVALRVRCHVSLSAHEAPGHSGCGAGRDNTAHTQACCSGACAAPSERRQAAALLLLALLLLARSQRPA